MAEFYNSIGSLDRKWHVGLMIVSSLLAISVLGPGWYSEDVLAPYHWHYSFFSWLCHQDPTRSFDFMGAQMAVCSRCLGIYSSFSVGIYFLWFIKIVGYQLSYPFMRKVLLASIVMNGLDILSNALNIWTNTLYSRLLMGILFGLAAALILGSVGTIKPKPTKFHSV